MECTFCPGNQATCHLSKLVNAKSIDVHVCEKCIPQLSQKDLVDFDVWAAVSKLAASKGKEEKEKGALVRPSQQRPTAQILPPAAFGRAPLAGVWCAFPWRL